MFYKMYYLPCAKVCLTLSLMFSPWSTESIEPGIFLVTIIVQFAFMKILQNGPLCVDSGWGGGGRGKGFVWKGKSNLLIRF